MIYIIPTDTCYGLACRLSDEAGYQSIYVIKGRDFDKPLAFLIESFADIGNCAKLTDEQITILQNYPHPFTLLTLPKAGTLPDFLDPIEYRQIGLRVAERCIDAKIRSVLPFPLFLTSANRSRESECRTVAECERLFVGSNMEYTAIDGGMIGNPPSDIFSFIGETTEIEYTRKNYP